MSKANNDDDKKNNDPVVTPLSEPGNAAQDIALGNAANATHPDESKATAMQAAAQRGLSDREKLKVQENLTKVIPGQIPVGYETGGGSGKKPQKASEVQQGKHKSAQTAGKKKKVDSKITSRPKEKEPSTSLQENDKDNVGERPIDSILPDDGQLIEEKNETKHQGDVVSGRADLSTELKDFMTNFQKSVKGSMEELQLELNSLRKHNEQLLRTQPSKTPSDEPESKPLTKRERDGRVRFGAPRQGPLIQRMKRRRVI